MANNQLPMLGEHQSASDLTEGPPPGYSPSDTEKAALKLVNKLFEKAKKHKKKYDEHWLEDYKMFRGRQWKEQRPSYRHSEVINMVFQNIQAVVPIMTDTRPQISFIPQEPHDMELSEILNQLAEADWVTNNWLETLTENIYDSHFYGASLASMEIDEDSLETGVPKIIYQTEDVFHCFPDPNARNVNKKSKFFILAEPVDLDVIKSEYPEKGKFVKADLLEMGMTDHDKTDLGDVKFKSPVDQKVILDGQKDYDLGEHNKALKLTAWILSDEIDEEEATSVDPLTGLPTTEYTQKLKYPNGRKICIAGGVVLDDCANPYEDGLFPYARLLNYPLPREFWGISDIEQLKSPQKIFNKLVSFSLDVLTLMGNPIWVIDNTSGVDTDNLYNRPGLVLEKEPGSEVRREGGVELQPFVLQLIDRMKTWFDDISGSNEFSRGAGGTGGITAASAIQSIQESAQTRIRQKTRNVDAFLQDLGQLYLSRVFQFYTTPRVVRITSNQNADKYFKFHIEHTQDEYGNTQKIAKIRDFVLDPETNQMAASIDDRAFPIKGSFDVRVSTGSSLPFAKEEKFSVATELFKLGVIDDEALLKDADYPNWEQVLARMQQKKAEQAQLQASQPQQKPLT